MTGEVIAGTGLCVASGQCGCWHCCPNRCGMEVLLFLELSFFQGMMEWGIKHLAGKKGCDNTSKEEWCEHRWDVPGAAEVHVWIFLESEFNREIKRITAAICITQQISGCSLWNDKDRSGFSSADARKVAPQFLYSSSDWTESTVSLPMTVGFCLCVLRQFWSSLLLW